MPTFKLFDLMLDRVDLCGAGANPDASIMLFKSKEEPVPQKKKPAAKTAKGKADSRSKAKQRGDEEEEEEEEEEIVAKADDDEDDDSADDDDEDAVDEDEEEEEPPARRKTKKATKKADKKPAKKVAKADDDDEDDDPIDDDDDEEVEDDLSETVLKSLPVSARAAIERNQRIAKRARKDAREAREMALTEKSRRERLEFIAKAKKEIPNLTGTEEDKGELLQALYSGTVTKKQADSLVKMLKAADAAQRSLLMAEQGSGRARTDDEDSAIAEINTLTEELMEKDTKLTKAQARTKVCEDNPKLYQRYKMEKRRTVDAN